MCFRPGAMEMPEIKCPECDKKLNIDAGATLEECPFCGVDLNKYADKFKVMLGFSSNAPAMPAPPGALNAPKPPAPKPPAPAAPKPPSGAPKPPSSL